MSADNGSVYPRHAFGRAWRGYTSPSKVGGGLYHHLLWDLSYSPWALRFSSVTASARAPLQLRCTSVAASVTVPLQLRYSSRYSFRYSSVAAPLLAPLHLRYSSFIASVTAPLQDRYQVAASASAPLQLATAGSDPLQPSDTAPLQLRVKSVTAPLLSGTVSVTIPVTGEHFCHSRGLQMMVEPRPNSKEYKALAPQMRKNPDTYP